MANYTETVTYDLRVDDNWVGIWLSGKPVAAWRPEDGLSGFILDTDGSVISSMRSENPRLAKACAIHWAKHVLDRKAELSDAAEKVEPEPNVSPDVPGTKVFVTPRRIVAMCGSPESALIAFDDGTIWLRTDDKEKGELDTPPPRRPLPKAAQWHIDHTSHSGEKPGWEE